MSAKPQVDSISGSEKPCAQRHGTHPRLRADLAQNTENDAFFESLFWFALTPLALGSVTTWIAQAFKLSFENYYYLLFAALIAGVGMLLLLEWKTVKFAFSRVHLANKLLFLAIGMICGTSSLLQHFTIADDYYYLGNAVYAVQHPHSSMGFEVNFIATLGKPLTSFAYVTSGPFEYMQAAFARLLGLDVLDVYSFIFPPVSGFYTALVFLYIARLFVNSDTAALIGGCAGLGATFLLLDSLLSIGNMYFSRSYQGKFLYVKMFLTHSRRYLASFLLASIAGMGMTASAIVITPIVAATFSVVFLVTNTLEKRYPTSDLVKLLMKYWLCLAPIFAYGLIYKIYFSAGMGADSLANVGWPSTVSQTIDWLLFWSPQWYLNPNAAPVFSAFSYSLPIALLSYAAAVYLSAGTARRVLVLWGLISVAIFWNPIVGDFLIQTFHLQSIYWRVAYALPFPLCIGVAMGRIFETLGNVYTARTTALTASSIAALAASSLLAPYSVGELALPPQHRDPATRLPDYQDIIEVASHLPSGVVLAPTLPAGLLAVRFSNLKNLAIWGHEVLWLQNENMRQDGEDRVFAARFLQFGEQKDVSAFVATVQKYRPDIVIANRKSRTTAGSVFDSLNRDYFLYASTSDHLIYRKR
jgi:hypothetical protein